MAQGWTPNFLPGVISNASVKPWDAIEKVTDEDAIATARLLASQEGLLVGISSGGTFAAALAVAKTAPQGSTILAMLPDTAERYLSTALFAGINEGTDTLD